MLLQASGKTRVEHAVDNSQDICKMELLLLFIRNMDPIGIDGYVESPLAHEKVAPKEAQLVQTVAKFVERAKSVTPDLGELQLKLPSTKGDAVWFTEVELTEAMGGTTKTKVHTLPMFACFTHEGTRTTDLIILGDGSVYNCGESNNGLGNTPNTLWIARESHPDVHETTHPFLVDKKYDPLTNRNQKVIGSGDKFMLGGNETTVNITHRYYRLGYIKDTDLDMLNQTLDNSLNSATNLVTGEPIPGAGSN